MRRYIFSSFTGALGLAAIAASAPALSSPDDCVAPNTEIVFVTVQGSANPSTVYVTVPVSSVEANLSEAPTSTLTRFATLYSTTTSPHTSTEYVSATQKSSAGKVGDPYHITVTETARVTVSDVSLTPLPSGGSLTYSETAAPDGILNYVVENGTTYWLGGQTPAPYESYVYATSSVTVVPVDPSEWASEQATSTVTLHQTIYYTQLYTFTETLDPGSTSSGNAGAGTLASAGTGLPYTKGSGGWNATKTSSVGGAFSGVTNAVSVASAGAGILATGSPSFVLYSSFEIHKTSQSTYSLSSLAAKSGFYAFSTPVSMSVAKSSADPGTVASGSRGEFTTAVINGQTVTWGGPSGVAKTSLDNCTETPYASPTGAPYANSTVATSARGTSGASAAFSSLSSVSPIASAVINSTISASSLPGLSSLSSTLTGPSNSSVATSSARVTLPSSSSLAPSHNSSSALTISTSSSSALGALTSSSAKQPTTLSSSSSHVVNSSSSTVASSTSAGSLFGSTSAAISSSSVTPSQTFTSQTSASVSSTNSATPSTCGEHGDFLLNFDDIPPLSIGKQDPNTVEPEPVFNPYHQFDFSDGFVVVPPPTDPYLPSSPPLLLEFIPNFNVNGTNTQAGPNTAEDGYSGQISDGDGDRTGCFHFNVYGASFGCDSKGPDCEFTFSGYQLDASATGREEVQITTQTIAVPACPALANCTLTPVTLDNTFENLAFIRINVTVAQQPKIWWMDDLRMGWYNNSCTTGLCRTSTHLQ